MSAAQVWGVMVFDTVVTGFMVAQMAGCGHPVTSPVVVKGRGMS